MFHVPYIKMNKDEKKCAFKTNYSRRLEMLLSK